ncbi:MAG: polysaccharide deacetylase family protein [Bradymonadaceae bacterium]
MDTGADRPKACVTIDLDTLQCYRDIHGLEHDMVGHGGDPTYTVGLRRALELFDRMDISATFFVVGRDTTIPVHHDLLQEADESGHELANHTYSHYYDLADRRRSDQQSELARGEGAIASVTGKPPSGFRAPGYNITPRLLDLCRSREYVYDSSIFPCPPYWVAKQAVMLWQRLRGRPSRSRSTPAENLLAPLSMYRPDRDRIWQHDSASPFPPEIPMCVVPGIRFPVIGTSLHVLGERGFSAIYPFLRNRYRQILNLEFHAVDFIDRTDLPDDDGLPAVQPDLGIPWEEKRDRYAHVFNVLREDYIFETLERAVAEETPDAP